MSNPIAESVGRALDAANEEMARTMEAKLYGNATVREPLKPFPWHVKLRQDVRWMVQGAICRAARKTGLDQKVVDLARYLGVDDD